MSTENRLPFVARIEHIHLINFNATSKIDLMPQFRELVVFESVFAPLLKAELVIHDEIGLFVNFPLTGEEFINISYRNTDDKKVHLINTSFIISAVKDIRPSNNARSYTYVLHLVSRPAYENSKTKVSHAYHGKVSEISKELFRDYIVQPAHRLNLTRRVTGSVDFAKENFIFDDVEESLEARTVVIPRLRPVDALLWLARRAVSSNYQKNYVYSFWQTISGFHFKSIQSIWNDDPTAKKLAKDDPYFFISNIELTKKETIKIEGTVVNPRKSVTNLHVNKRYSTIDKITEGYFQNDLFEINLFQNAYKDTRTTLEDTKSTLDDYDLNTSEYSTSAHADNDTFLGANVTPNIEVSNNVKYVFNNNPDFEPSSELFHFRDKYGHALRSQVAFSNIDFTITVEGDTNVEAGTIIYLIVPEMHGFNQIKSDKLVTGYYLVTDVKHIFSVGEKHKTAMTINKDSYAADLDSMDFNYVTTG